MYAFTETWLNDNTCSRQLFDDTYTVHRQDRSPLNSTKRCGGGVMLAIRACYKSRLLTPPNCANVEQVWAALTLTAKTLYICVVYIPPDCVNDTRVIDSHLQSLNWILGLMKSNDEILVVGDFNLPFIHWTAAPRGCFYPDSCNSNISPLIAKLLDDYSLAGLVQRNGTLNNNHRLLDLCFCNSGSSLPCSVEMAPSALVKTSRHHPELIIAVHADPPPTFTDPAVPFTYDFKKADTNSMCQFLDSINWTELLSGCTADDAARILSHVLQFCIGQFIPIKEFKKPTKPAWSNDDLKRLKSAKRAALRQLPRHQTNDHRATQPPYSVINQQYKQLNAQLFARYQCQLQDQLKSNPKSFWNHVNSQRKETGLPSTMTDGSTTASSTDDIAKLFSSQFCKVFNDEVLNDRDVNDAVRHLPRLPSVGPFPTISAEAVANAGSRLKGSTNPGPDGIPAILLKNCMSSLAVPLSTVFNLSISTGTFPECWKEAFVFPVFKKGNKQDVSNYRGIAALCAISKLFEILVLDYMKFKFSRLIAAEQHGFMSKRSTASNLVAYTSYIIEEIEKGHQTDAIYTDFSAAFDKINHNIAIAKFERLGITGSFLRWIGSYLIGRQMSVKIGPLISPAFPVTSGVPQGSHLGPFLFLLYLNDVHATLDCRKLSFADDFKLYHTIIVPEDVNFLQQQLDTFAVWCQRNRMALNASKCSVISFSRKHSTTPYNYNLAGTILKRETCVKDLGVMLDSKMTFKNHVSYIVSKAASLLGFIFRYGKDFRDVYCLKTLYCSLVRSTLEYCSVVWSPFYKNSIQRIEAIQRRFIRFALRFLPWSNPHNLPSYESRCKLIDLDSLELRRNVSKAAFISDLLTSNIDCPELLHQIRFNIPRYRLRAYLPLAIRTSRTNYGSHLPLKLMCRVFNQCYDVFDFNLSRSCLKDRFRRALAQL